MQRKFGFIRLTAVALGFAASSACSNNDNQRADAALANDLALAAQQRAYQPLDSLSTAERTAALGAVSGTAVGVAAAAPGPRRTASTTTRRSTGGTATRSTSGTSRTTTNSGGEVTVKHTKRDAAIGAAAGAIIGATTSKNKVKGGIIGAAVGGIIGGVIGNNVDVQKKKVP